MKPSKVTIGPAARVPWKDGIVLVKNSRDAIKKLGLVGDEVEEFLEAVHDVAPSLVKYGRPSIRGAAVAFVRGWLASDGSSVSNEEIERRSKICLDCDQKTHIEIGCPTCADAARTLLKAPKVPDMDGLACRKCYCYLAVKVTQTDEVLRADQRKIKYPSHCWMNDVLK